MTIAVDLGRKATTQTNKQNQMSLTQNRLKLWEGLGTVIALNIWTVGFKQNQKKKGNQSMNILIL